MTGDLTAQRRFFAEEVQAVCNLRTASLVEALATVHREAFLAPGPWIVFGEGDFAAPPRTTPDADPRHLYHNLSVAIDPERRLFNGAPGVVSMCIDALDLRAGQAVLHVGCGLGYYSAVLAHCVGPEGRVTAIEVDETLAEGARRNLASIGWVTALRGQGTETSGDGYDAILVNAGMTHPHEAWLAALRPGGRLVIPLTFTMELMGPIGKGAVALLRKDPGGGSFEARPVTYIAVYNAIGLRNAALNEQLREAYKRSPWPTFKRLRRDPHAASPSCWLHGDTFCLSSV
jgi:protein-L-isoaspartate(D-aspartate) O-methyltransferase